MNNTIINATPTRAEVRETLAYLEQLEPFNITWVAEQLKAVRALARTRYPRASKATRKRRGLPASASRCVCGHCGGRGTQNRPTPGVPPIPCPNCRGAGVVDGVGETVVAYGHDDGPPSRIRGDLARAEFTGQPDMTPRRQTTHSRGYVAGTPQPDGSRGAAGQARMLGQVEYRVAGYAGDAPYTRPTPIDLSAMLEGQAAAALSGLNFHVDPRTGVETRVPRGRRINGSRREQDVLKPGGQRRSRMVDRVGRLQADYDRANKPKAPPRPRPEADPVVEQLRALGIDPGAYIKAARTQLDSDRVERARRGGDLPPADFLPDWAADSTVMLSDGRVVRVQGVRLGRSCVARLGSGETQWVEEAVMVRDELGDLDLLHPLDVPEDVPAG